jgi:hypothetical protein
MPDTEGKPVPSATEPEQRGTRRFALQLPVSVKYADGKSQDESALTRDVSARGVYFYVDSKLAVGSDLEFTLTLPSEITLTDSIRVRCKGKVVRVEENPSASKVGVAAAIEQYDFISDTQT